MLNRIDLSRIDLNLLVLFEAVIETRHVGRAAARLSLTPSAVSHGLGRLRRLLCDPLFLRTPRGVTPTARALALAGPVAAVLAGARGVIAAASPFDPASSTRRFAIGAPDAILDAILPSLLSRLGRFAPGVDVAAVQLLPNDGAGARAWRNALTALESGGLDIVVLPLEEAPARFHLRRLYDEDFVIASAEDGPFAADPSLDAYCAAGHLLVSASGEPRGFVDDALAAMGRSRRIALTAPGFFPALAVAAETDLVLAAPRRLVAAHGARFGLTASPPPLPLPVSRIAAVVPEAALADPGVAWLLDLAAEP